MELMCVHHTSSALVCVCFTSSTSFTLPRIFTSRLSGLILISISLISLRNWETSVSHYDMCPQLGSLLSVSWKQRTWKRWMLVDFQVSAKQVPIHQMAPINQYRKALRAFLHRRSTVVYFFCCFARHIENLHWPEWSFTWQMPVLCFMYLKGERFPKILFCSNLINRTRNKCQQYYTI